MGCRFVWFGRETEEERGGQVWSWLSVAEGWCALWSAEGKKKAKGKRLESGRRECWCCGRVSVGLCWWQRKKKCRGALVCLAGGRERRVQGQWVGKMKGRVRCSGEVEETARRWSVEAEPQRGKVWWWLLEAVRGEEGGGTGGGSIFYFLREEGLRLRNKNEFRVFFIFRVFCVWLPFSEKLPFLKNILLVNIFLPFFYTARGSFI